MHRAIGDGCAYLNYALWESNAAFCAAFSNPQFQAKLAAYPSSVVASPHLFQKIAVPGICDAWLFGGIVDSVGYPIIVRPS